jgi:hypothetical protein
LTAPATLDRMYDFPETAFDSLIDILRAPPLRHSGHSAHLDRLGNASIDQRR